MPKCRTEELYQTIRSFLESDETKKEFRFTKREVSLIEKAFPDIVITKIGHYERNLNRYLFFKPGAKLKVEWNSKIQ